jgi:hypothetical protein
MTKRFFTSRQLNALIVALATCGLLLFSQDLFSQDQTDTTISCVITDATTQGGTNGAASLSIINLEFPIAYEWQTAPPQTTPNIIDLSKGVYPVIFTDANGYTDTAECAVGEPYNGCYQARTQTQGGWGQKARGGNPGSYRDANFANAFPNGLVIGCPNGGYTVTLTSASAVQDFLPQGKTPKALTQDLTDATRKNYRNVLSGQVAALALSVGFDNYDPTFGQDSEALQFQEVASGSFAGWTIEQVLDVANEVLGGCNTSYSCNEINSVVSKINENYVDGKKSGGFISCVPNAGGFIGDFVWEDLNGNGSWETGENGIENVRIDLTYAGVDGALGTTDDVNIGYQLTNAQGAYGFSGLKAGLYRVDVDDLSLPINYFISTGNEPMEVTLGYNQTYLYADFGYEPRTAELGDWVWLDYNGDGNQDSGEPGLSGVEVTLTGIGGTSVATTGTDGYYLFDGLAAGSYTVEINTGSIALTAGFVTTTATSMNRTLTVGQSDLSVDFGVRPVGSGASATASIGDFVYEDIDGSASPDFGEPGINGVILLLTYANFDGVIGSGDDIGYPPAVAVGGMYSFNGLYPGVYKVEVIANVPAGLVATTVVSYTVTLTEGQNYDMADFGYNTPTSIIRGTVWNDKDGNAINNVGSEPTESGIGLSLYDAISGLPTGQTDVTAADGSYTFSGVTPGSYFVEINTSTFPSGTLLTSEGTGSGQSRFSQLTNRTGTIVLVGGEDIVRDAGIYTPGVVGLNLTHTPFAVFNQFIPVTYTYNVSNAGGIPLNGATVVLTDPDNSPVYLSGDANTNNQLENTETWVYSATRTWTWRPPTRNITVIADVDADDMQGNASTDFDNATVLVFGANVELSANQSSVCAGDTIEVTMTMRLKNSGFVPTGEDAQLANLSFACNLLNGGALNSTGPATAFWADPSGDYVSTTSGAEALALDADDYVDNDNGFTEADWIHSFNYVVPNDQASDLVITAYDDADFNYYDGVSWTMHTDIPPGMDTLVLTLDCPQAMQADEKMLTDIINGSVTNDAGKVVRVLETPLTYPNPFEDHMVLEIPESWTEGAAQIFDPMGKLIQELDLKESKTAVQFSTDVSGMYYVKISNGETTYIHVVTKQ